MFKPMTKDQMKTLKTENDLPKQFILDPEVGWKRMVWIGFVVFEYSNEASNAG